MKKACLWLVIGCLALAFTGCGKSNPAAPVEKAGAKMKKEDVTWIRVETYEFDRQLGGPTPNYFPTGFNNPDQIAIWQTAKYSSPQLFIADTGNNRIQRYNGHIPFGPIYPPDGKFNNPRGVAVNSIGDVYVSDTGNNRICAFFANGAYTEWKGSLLGFTSPVHLTVNDVAGVVWFCDRNTNSIWAVNTWEQSGISLKNLVDSNDPVEAPYGISNCRTYGPGYGFWFSDRKNHVRRIGGASLDLPKTEFSTPKGLTIDQNDNLYVADSAHTRILKFNASGKKICTISLPFGSGQGQMSNPRGVAVSQSGDKLYVTDDKHRIIIFKQKIYFMPVGWIF